MTKEKAVSLLSQMFLIQFSKEEHEALAMAIDALNADRKTEPQIDCKECKYVWWNSEAKRYECQIKKCPYSHKTENSSEIPNNSKEGE